MVVLKDLNLMPRSIIVKKQNMRLLKGLLITLAIIAPIVFLADVGSYFAESHYKKKIENQKSEIAALTSKDNNKDVIDTVKKKIEYRENVLKRIDLSRLQTTEFLNKLNSILPKDVSLSKLNIEPSGKVTMEGKADTEESILDFYHSLKISGIGDFVSFNKVVGTMGDGNKDGLTFNISFNLMARK